MQKNSLRDALYGYANVAGDLFYAVKNRGMLKRIKSGNTITAAEIFDRLKSMVVYPGLTPERERKVRKMFYPYKVSTLSHRELLSLTGNFSPEYLPQEMYYAYIDPHFNSHEKAVGLENKCLFERLFPGIPQPKSIAFRMNGCWVDSEYKQISRDELIDEVNGYPAVFVKEAYDSCGGHGVVHISAAPGGETVGALLEKTLRDMKGDIVIQLPIKQHKDLAALNPSSVNCLRIITLLDASGVRVLSSVQKIGAGDSHVDNLSSGGFICGIDGNGRLKRYAFSQEKGKTYRRHPVNGMVFEGYQLPSFRSVIDMVKKAHPMLPWFRLISWDVTVDEDGKPVLLEANLTNGGLDIHQMVNGPLFGNITRRVVKEALKGSDFPTYPRRKRHK